MSPISISRECRGRRAPQGLPPAPGHEDHELALGPCGPWLSPGPWGRGRAGPARSSRPAKCAPPTRAPRPAVGQHPRAPVALLGRAGGALARRPRRRRRSGRSPARRRGPECSRGRSACARAGRRGSRRRPPRWRAREPGCARPPARSAWPPSDDAAARRRAARPHPQLAAALVGHAQLEALGGPLAGEHRALVLGRLAVPPPALPPARLSTTTLAFSACAAARTTVGSPAPLSTASDTSPNASRNHSGHHRLHASAARPPTEV